MDKIRTDTDLTFLDLLYGKKVESSFYQIDDFGYERTIIKFDDGSVFAVSKDDEGKFALWIQEEKGPRASTRGVLPRIIKLWGSWHEKLCGYRLQNGPKWKIPRHSQKGQGP